MAASVVGAMSTVGAVFIAAPIGLAFDGTLVPLAAGTFVCSSLAWWLMRRSREADPEPKKTVPALSAARQAQSRSASSPREGGRSSIGIAREGVEHQGPPRAPGPAGVSPKVTGRVLDDVELHVPPADGDRAA
jgi:hypothetical protein